MSEIRSYRDLIAWQEGVALVEGCYRFSSGFPKEELFGLTSQLRRAAVSIPANIAEGYGRKSKGSYVAFLRNAQGSLKELETHLMLAQRLKLGAFDAAETLLQQCERLGRMLRAPIRKIQNSADW